MLKLVCYIFMALYFKLVIDFFANQWNLISNTWGIFITALLLIGLLEWMILYWIKKEKLDSINGIIEIEKEKNNFYSQKNKNLQEKIIDLEKNIIHLKEENNSLAKGIFLDEESKQMSYFNFQIDRYMAMSNNEIKTKLKVLLIELKKYLEGTSLANKGIEETFSTLLRSSEYFLFLLDTIIERALARQKNSVVLPKRDELDFPSQMSKKDKLVFINIMMNKLNNISD